MVSWHTDPGDTRKGIGTKEVLELCNNDLGCYYSVMATWVWMQAVLASTLVVQAVGREERSNRVWLVLFDCASRSNGDDGDGDNSILLLQLGF